MKCWYCEQEMAAKKAIIKGNDNVSILLCDNCSLVTVQDLKLKLDYEKNRKIGD